MVGKRKIQVYVNMETYNKLRELVKNGFATSISEAVRKILERYLEEG